MNLDNIQLDFRYLDKHIDMIKSKIKTYATISVFNGYTNRIYIITKIDNNFRYEYVVNEEKVAITYEDIIADVMLLYKSSVGKITMIYRLFMDIFNSKTNGEFRELWGDMLYIDIDTFKLTPLNIGAENLSNIVVNLKLSDKEIELFGRVEDYVFKDNENNTIMGIDLS